MKAAHPALPTRPVYRNHSHSLISQRISTYPFLLLFCKLLASVGKYIRRKRLHCRSRLLCWSQRWNITHENTNDCSPSCHKTPFFNFLNLHTVFRKSEFKQIKISYLNMKLFTCSIMLPNNFQNLNQIQVGLIFSSCCNNGQL